MRYEIFIRDYLPTIRALVARKLIDNGLTQQEVANKLHLTQPAIAFYKKSLRGKKIEEFEKREEVRKKIDEITRKIMTRNLKGEELEREYMEIFSLI